MKKGGFVLSCFTLSAFADEISMNLKTQMDVLKEHNISYIEMRGVNGKHIIDHTIEEAKEVKRQLDSRGFRLSSIGSPIGKISIRDDHTSHLELFKHTLELAELLESKYIRMFSFYIPKGDSPQIYRDEVMYRWSKFVELAKDSGTTLLHENEKDIYGDTALRCLDLMQTMNCDYVKSAFDPANFIQCDVRTYPYAYELLENYIDYVHIKDAVFSDHHVVPAGHGDGKVKDILIALSKRGYHGFLSLEPHLGQFAGFAKLELTSKWSDSPDKGPKIFGVAADALKSILNEIKV